LAFWKLAVARRSNCPQKQSRAWFSCRRRITPAGIKRYIKHSPILKEASSQLRILNLLRLNFDCLYIHRPTALIANF
jgi:hypothetical protein